MDSTKTRQFCNKYPELYFHNLHNAMIDYNKSFLHNLSHYFPFGIPNDASVSGILCRKFVEAYYNENTNFLSVDSVYGLAYSCIVCNKYTDMTFIDFIRFYDEVCKDVIREEYLKTIYDEIRNTSYF